MVAQRGRAGPSPLLLVVLVAAFGVGAAASLVLSSRTAGPPPPTGPVGQLFVPDSVVVLAIVVILGLVFVPILIDRLRGSAAVPGRVIVTVLVILFLMVGVVAILHLVTGGGSVPGVGSGSGNPTNGTNQSGTTGGTGSNLSGPGGFPVLLPGSLGPWTLFVVVVVVVAVAALAIVPRTREYLRERGEAVARRHRLEASSTARQAFDRASAELGAGADPRLTILALYASLLRRIAPLAGDVEHATAEEIRSAHLLTLGIRPAAAEALTRLFEEARYSSHPLSMDAAERARTAVREAAEDLGRLRSAS